MKKKMKKKNRKSRKLLKGKSQKRSATYPLPVWECLVQCSVIFSMASHFSLSWRLFSQQTSIYDKTQIKLLARSLNEHNNEAFLARKEKKDIRDLQMTSHLLESLHRSWTRAIVHENLYLECLLSTRMLEKW